MRRGLRYLIFGCLFFVLWGIPAFASAQTLNESEKQELLSRLKEECYEPYKARFEGKQRSVSVTARERLEDLSKVSQVPQQFSQYIEESQRRSLGELEEESTTIREDYRKWAQVNVDLAACYERELADYPQLLAKARELSAVAEQELAQVEEFDFSRALVGGQETVPTITLAPRSTRILRLRTFCLDSDRSYPDRGEEFYLAGHVDDLKPGLCQILKQGQTAKSADALWDVQGLVWGREEPSAPEKEEEKPSVSKIKAWEMSVGGAVVFLIILILGLVKLGRIANRALLIFLRIIWLIVLAGLLVLTGVGIWQLKKLGYFGQLAPKGQVPEQAQVSAPALSRKSSLADAARAGSVLVKVYSTGSIHETDIKVTNRTSKELELDVSCLYFIPAETGLTFEKISRFLQGFIALAAPGGSQKLGSAGAMGAGAPMPSDPTSPEGLIEKLKEQAEKDLQDSMEKYKENPNEETLKEVLDDLATCQLVGCAGEEGAGEEIADSWQDRTDQATENYQNNPSGENREDLMRTTEICQAVGCDSSAAEEALGF